MTGQRAMMGSVNCVAHRSDGQRFAALSEGAETRAARETLGALIFSVQVRIARGPAAANHEQCAVGEVLDSQLLAKTPWLNGGQQRAKSAASWI
jgi:hypothetical protein